MTTSRASLAEVSRPTLVDKNGNIKRLGSDWRSVVTRITREELNRPDRGVVCAQWRCIPWFRPPRPCTRDYRQYEAIIALIEEQYRRHPRYAAEVNDPLLNVPNGA